MMGGDVLPQSAFSPKDLTVPAKHEYVTVEATLLVAVLVLFYMAVILILFGVNVPCVRFRRRSREIPRYEVAPVTTQDDRPNFQQGRSRILVDEDEENDEEELDDLEEERDLLPPCRDLQVVAFTNGSQKVMTVLNPQSDSEEQGTLEGISVL